VCVEVQTPSLSVYIVSCYFQYSDEIEGHLEKMLHSLRDKRLIVVDINARSSLWGFYEIDKRGRKFEIFIRTFGLVINEGLTRRRSFHRCDPGVPLNKPTSVYER